MFDTATVTTRPPACSVAVILPPQSISDMIQPPKTCPIGLVSVGIARVLALRPELLIADEPVSALDVSVQVQILALLQDLKDRLGLTMLFFTHDRRVAAQICDRIAVTQKGIIVEEGPTAEVFAAPRHAYTGALLDSIPGWGWTPPEVDGLASSV